MDFFHGPPIGYHRFFDPPQHLLPAGTAISLLRHEILVQFHRFKEEHQALVEKVMKSNAGEIT